MAMLSAGVFILQGRRGKNWKASFLKESSRFLFPSFPFVSISRELFVDLAFLTFN
jgi:hypothetical protein